MSRAALAAALVAAALAPRSAAAFARSSDASCGVCFYWPTRAVPFAVNPPGDDPDGVLEVSCAATDATGAAGAVRAGFEAWSAPACTDLALVVSESPSTSAFVGYAQGAANENLVVFRKGICQDLVGDSDPCWRATVAGQTCDAVHNCFLLDGTTSRSTIALTTVTYSPSSGRILDADMELIAWDGLVVGSLPPSGAPPDGWYFTCAPPSGLSRCASYGDSGCFSMDLRNTVTHEAGHFIGLAHPCELPSCGGIPGVTETTMYPSASVGETKKQTLETDDVNGVCTVYPAGAASPTCPSSCAEESSGCGCGTASPSGALGALLGLAALCPRLRRRRAQDTTTAA